MPVSVDVPYSTYQAQLREGRLSLADSPCPNSTCREASGGTPLVLTRSTVDRGIIWLKKDEYGVLQTVSEQIRIAIAWCPNCGMHVRVLPCDILPRKTYSLAVIEHEISGYTQGGRSLRAVVWGMHGEHTPAHTTLHGWTEGFGAYLLGRPAGEVPGALPASRLITESEARKPRLAEVRAQGVAIDPRRYRSEARRERLVAAAVFLVCAQVVSGQDAPWALAEWSRLSLSWGLMSPFGFRTGLFFTAIEQVGSPDGGGSGRRQPKEVPRCPIRTRSPPGASSR